MSENRMTPLQLLEARVTTMEEHIKRLSDWTGFDEDDDPSEKVTSPDDRLLAQQIVIQCLLKQLEALRPEFTVERFAATVREELASQRAKLSPEESDPELEQQFDQALDRVIGVLPRKQMPQKAGKARLFLVGTNLDEPAQEP